MHSSVLSRHRGSLLSASQALAVQHCVVAGAESIVGKYVALLAVRMRPFSYGRR